MTLGARLFAAVGVSVAIVVIGGVVLLWNTWNVRGEADIVKTRAAAQELEFALERAVTAMASHESALLMASLNQDAPAVEAHGRKWADAMGVARKSADALRKALAAQAGLTEVEALRASLDRYNGIYAQLQAQLKAGNLAEAAALHEKTSGPLLEEAIATVSALSLASLDNIRAAADSTAAEVRQMFTLLVAVLLLQLPAAAGIGVVVRRVSAQLRRAVVELKRGATQVTSAAAQVAASAQSLSQGATEQAASLEETSASMEEMAAMTRRNSDNARNAAALADHMVTEAQSSTGALSEMVLSMGAIRESSGKVAQIIKTIDEIAFQTNILALNAAVEAARAGEAGMGFAVVADEVRNLAQRSAQAAQDTAAMIEESINRSHDGAVRVEQVAQAIEAFTGTVDRVRVMVGEVREASEQQTQGIEQVSQAISQMEKVTQTTAATAEESSAASEELSGQAASTMELVRGLSTMVGDAPSGEPRRVPVPVAAGAAARRAPLAAVPPRAPKAAFASPGARAAARASFPLVDAERDFDGETGTFGKF
jgi:methyl-accepting chemotaxis protein